MILYINACVRAESRTSRIGAARLEKLGGEYHEVFLPDMKLEPLSRELLEKRTEYIEKKDYSDAMFDLAKQFANADIIVISAPYWDGSFPSVLKVYLENIYVTGLVSEYDENGMQRGLCMAGKLYYVTTAGGPDIPDYSYGYIRHLAKEYFGIGETSLVKAEMPDVYGYDAEKIVEDTIIGLRKIER